MYPIAGVEGPDQIAAAAARFEAILDSLDEGVVVMNDDCRVIGINHAACNLLETTKHDVLNRGCAFPLADRTCTPGSAVRESIRKREPIRDLELEIETPSGRRRALSIRTAVFREKEGASGGLVIFRDITELARLRRDLDQRYRLHNIIGKSKPIQDVFELIEQLADADAGVLVEGETGTGKELVARAIHYAGPRGSAPFVAVNCSALPETLLESELFGHVKGAFTGAEREKIGRFERAHGGTIFLDEIGEVSPAIQVKLLRVLQERKIERLGDAQPRDVDIRVVAATNRDLAQLVENGKFRQDLYYRLRVVPIRMPALRERRDDIPLLAQHFVDRFRERTGRPITAVDESALTLMLDYPWPGNVRELENTIEYAFVKARQGRICAEHLPTELKQAGETMKPRPAEPSHPTTPNHQPNPDDRRNRRGQPNAAEIQNTLRQTGGNIARTARQLNISRTTLYKRIRELGLNAGKD